MRSFLPLLVCLAAIAFVAGFQSAENTTAKVPPESKGRLTHPVPDQVASHDRPTAHRQGQADSTPDMPVLPDETLDKIEFEKISGGKVTPVARRLLQLSEPQCARIAELITWRDAQLRSLRDRQEQQAFLVEPDPEIQDRYGIPMLTWEIPIGDRGAIHQEFHQRITTATSGMVADRLFGRPVDGSGGSAGTPRHQVSAVKGDTAVMLRFEFIEYDGRRYNSHLASIPFSEVSERFRAVIERELALLEDPGD